MSGFLGADTEQLRAHADVLRQRAERIIEAGKRGAFSVMGGPHSLSAERVVEALLACGVHAGQAISMLEAGVYLPPSQYEACFVSLAHDDEDLERIVNAAGRAMARLE